MISAKLYRPESAYKARPRYQAIKKTGKINDLLVFFVSPSEVPHRPGDQAQRVNGRYSIN